MENDMRPWVRIGLLLADADRCEEANRYLINAIERGVRPNSEINSALEKCSSAGN